MIVTKDLRKVYGGACAVEAVRGVSMEVADGEFLAIVGPSGSGKSTLMNLLGCLDRATDGYYALDGQDVTRLDRDGLAGVRSRKIGFVFQNFNLLPRMTAEENVALPLVYWGVPLPERRERARQALDRVGLCRRREHLPGGDARRSAAAHGHCAGAGDASAAAAGGRTDGRSGRHLGAGRDALHGAAQRKRRDGGADHA